jgi:DNA polymerase
MARLHHNGEPVPAAGGGVPGAHAGLANVHAAALRCRACPLWASAMQTVFGEGPEHARDMLIGEQPGDREDVQGRPFVGPAGKLLDRPLTEAGIDRDTFALFVAELGRLVEPA